MRVRLRDDVALLDYSAFATGPHPATGATVPTGIAHAFARGVSVHGVNQRALQQGLVRVAAPEAEALLRGARVAQSGAEQSELVSWLPGATVHLPVPLPLPLPFAAQPRAMDEVDALLAEAFDVPALYRQTGRAMPLSQCREAGGDGGGEAAAAAPTEESPQQATHAARPVQAPPQLPQVSLLPPMSAPSPSSLARFCFYTCRQALLALVAGVRPPVLPGVSHRVAGCCPNSVAVDIAGGCSYGGGQHSGRVPYSLHVAVRAPPVLEEEDEDPHEPALLSIQAKTGDGVDLMALLVGQQQQEQQQQLVRSVIENSAAFRFQRHRVHLLTGLPPPPPQQQQHDAAPLFDRLTALCALLSLLAVHHGSSVADAATWPLLRHFSFPAAYSSCVRATSSSAAAAPPPQQRQGQEQFALPTAVDLGFTTAPPASVLALLRQRAAHHDGSGVVGSKRARAECGGAEAPEGSSVVVVVRVLLHDAALGTSLLPPADGGVAGVLTISELLQLFSEEGVVDR